MGIRDFHELLGNERKLEAQIRYAGKFRDLMELLYKRIKLQELRKTKLDAFLISGENGVKLVSYSVN